MYIIEKIPEFNYHLAFDKAVVPGKMNIDPRFIPDYRLVLLICIYVSCSYPWNSKSVSIIVYTSVLSICVMA